METATHPRSERGTLTPNQSLAQSESLEGEDRDYFASVNGPRETKPPVTGDWNRALKALWGPEWEEEASGSTLPMRWLREAERRTERPPRDPVTPRQVPNWVREPVSPKRDCGAVRTSEGAIMVHLSGSARYWTPGRDRAMMVPARSAWSLRSALDWLNDHLTPGMGSRQSATKGWRHLRYVVHSRVVPALFELFRTEGGPDRESWAEAVVMGA